MELTDEIIEKCNCSECAFKEECKHRESFRRYPVEFGGTGSCQKLHE